MGVIATLEAKRVLEAGSNNAPLSAAQQAARTAQIPSQNGRGSRVIDGKRVRFGADGQQLQDALVWINVGVEIQGEDGPEMLSLPFNIALDQMGDLDTSGTNPQAVAKRKARNKLKADLVALAKSMKPGERTKLNLSVELYVKAEDVVISDEENPYVVDVSSLIAG